MKRWFLAGGLLVALLLAGIGSSFASSAPDGLDSVTREGCTYSGDEVTGGECMAREAREHEVGGPLADYGIAGIDNPYLSTGLAGVLGVLLVFGLGAGLFWLARRRSGSQPVPASHDVPGRDVPGRGEPGRGEPGRGEPSHGEPGHGEH
ncbi:MAG: PDGLE domain-containing protein [Micromonosporaceae bacterium]